MKTTALSLAAVLLLGSGTAPAVAQSDILLKKLTNGQDADAPPGPVLVVGAPVTWTFVVTNSGSRDLSNVAVTDDQGVTVTCPASFLPAGESMTCTGSGVATEGQYENVGTVTAELPNGTPVSASDPSHYFGQAGSSVTLEKRTNGFDADAPPGPSLPVGSPVTWTYEVTNVGTQTLSGIEVTDSEGVVVTCPGTELEPNASMTCTGSGIVEPGQYSNTGTVTASLPDESPVAASDLSHYFGQALTLEKATNGEDADLPPGPSLLTGSAVTWTYVVTNASAEELTGVEVTDDQGVTVTCPGTTLAAGASMTCTGSGTAVLGQYVNQGRATAIHPTAGAVSATDLSHYVGREPTPPAVSATKAVVLLGDPEADPGDTLVYTVILRNTGDTTATGVVFTDTPDANTALVVGSVTTTAGAVVQGNTAGDAAVQVDVGDLASGATATVTFQVTIDDPLPEGIGQISNQGAFSGGNFTGGSTDDPSAPGATDPTVTPLGAPAVAEIPALGPWGLLALLVLLGGLGLRKLTLRAR
jgi:uncharacterized repeat protein (TIGR01451 family)